MKSDLSDNQLIELYKNGDRESLNIIIERYRDQIFRVLLVRIQNLDITEDLTQDICIKLTQNLHKYKDDTNFKGWIFTLAYNCMFDHFRKQKKKQKIYASDNEYSFKVLTKIYDDELVLCDDTKMQLIKLVDQLPEDQKIVVIERIFNQKTYKEIAEEHDIKLNTALARMRYALIKLRQLVRDNNIQLSA